MKLYTSSETRKIDNLAIRSTDYSSFSLMQKAAEFSLNVLLQNWNEIKRVIIFCGKGNNAGDGYILASLLSDIGKTPILVQVSKSMNISAASKRGLRLCKSKKIRIIGLGAVNNLKITKNDVIVDALLGTGLKGNVKGKILESIKIINSNKRKCSILSLDIPSGICSDTGNELGLSVEANTTATFITKKRGCFTSKGREQSGKIEFSDLSVSKKIINKIPSRCHLISMERGIRKLTKRNIQSHKGHFGHVLVIGGNKGFGGAAILAAKAALKSGSGLVSLATLPEHLAPALGQCPELMVKGVESGQDLEPYLEEPTVIVIGPGLGKNAWSEQLLQRVFWVSERRNLCTVMDADALNLLSKLRFKSPLPKKLIITPHPGEAARLLKKSVKEVENDRFKTVQELERKFNAIAVLKGSGTLIGFNKSSKQHIGICEAGNPGMASGGMGDVLSGLIGSFLAQGLNLIESTETAVDIHSKAADIAAMEKGELGLVASDVINNITHLLKP